jgi:hypothetical protein
MISCENSPIDMITLDAGIHHAWAKAVFALKSLLSE